MLQWMARGVLVLGSVGFAVFGGLLLLWPVETMARIGFEVAPGIGATEIRAFYGGAELALAVLIAMCATRPHRLADGLVLNGLVYGLIGLSRLYGMGVDGTQSSFLWIALGTELGLALASLVLWRSLRAAAR